MNAPGSVTPGASSLSERQRKSWSFVGRIPVAANRPLGDAVLKLLDRLENSHSDEERKFLEVAGGASAFLSVTGQCYRFEDFRESARPGHVQSLEFAHVIRWLERKEAQTSSVEEEKALRTAADALAFIDSSGQH